MELERQNPAADALSARVQKGDHGAFDELMAQFRPLMLTMTNRFCSADNRSEWDELFQEARIALYRAACTYRSGGKVTFAHYARICIRNALIDRYRLREDTVSLSNEEVEKMLFPSDLPDPSERMVRDEEGQLLYQRIAAILSPYELQVFDGMVEGVRICDLAKQLGKTERSVSNAVYRLTNKLKGALNQYN